MLTTLLTATTALSSTVLCKQGSIVESLDDIFKTLGDDFKRLPLMVLPQAPQMLKQVPSKNKNEYRYELAMPGKNADHVSAQVDSETGIITVSIKGESEEETESHDENGATYAHSVSSSSQAFEQSFKAPKDSNLDTVAIDVKDGLLVLTIAKKPAGEEQSTLRSIPVNRSGESD